MKILVFLGSARHSYLPKPARLGQRVARAMLSLLEKDHADDKLVLVDPLDYDLHAVFKPHFAYPTSRAPRDLSQLADMIREADAYVMVSPEYNHSLSPALAHLLNHFGSSLYAYKPSLIVTYSAGQFSARGNSLSVLQENHRLRTAGLRRGTQLRSRSINHLKVVSGWWDVCAPSTIKSAYPFIYTRSSTQGSTRS